MIVTIKKNTNKNELNKLLMMLEEKGIKYTLNIGVDFDILLLSGNLETIDISSIAVFDFVCNVTRITKSYKLAQRKDKDTIIDINGIKIGGDNLVFIAGPCSIKSYDELKLVAKDIKNAGCNVLRCGTYKMRTSPYSFQGLKEEGLKILSLVGKEEGLLTVSEITNIEDVSLFEQYVDIIQVGARNMQNYPLLERLGKTNKPIILKRGMMASLEEFLLASEYILKNGNKNVILCERGIKNFDKETRNTLDLGSVAVLKKLTHLPIIVDPSHAAGRCDIIASLSYASVAVGAAGVMIECHNDPINALSDAVQAINPKELKTIVSKSLEIKRIIK